MTRCDAWEVLWATCGAKPSQNLKGCGMLVSDDISVVLRDSLAAFEILPACLGWEFRIRRWSKSALRNDVRLHLKER